VTAPARVLCCSDVHGHHSCLERGLYEAGWTPGQDGLVLLGDYIDRGPHSRRTVELVRRLAENPNVVVLQGNHEDMLFNYMHGCLPPERFFANGGMDTLRSYEGAREQLSADAEWLHSLPLYLEMDEVVLVHAGLRPGIPLGEQTQEDLLWIRDEFINHYDEGKTVVFGHTPTRLITGKDEVFWGTRKVGIDTGLTYGGVLSLLELPTFRTYQVARDPEGGTVR